MTTQLKLIPAAILLVVGQIFLLPASAADGGNNFADFYRQQQARLFSHIDDALSAQAEKAIGENFAAVRRADVELQTKLGGRKGNLGINLIGAFADAGDRAFGWQLRAFAAQESSIGGNAGVFYRAIDGDALYGANAFLDYEDGDYGGFARFGVGGEFRHSIFGLNANYYLPITDEQNVGEGVVAFSRRGFDAQLRIDAPNFDSLKGAVDYYNFDGKHNTAAEDGLRYGLELHPFPAFRFGLFYDSGGDGGFGGNIAYSHTIGEVRQQRKTDTAISAQDLFAPVRREYSQRIALATTATPPTGVFFDIAAAPGGAVYLTATMANDTVGIVGAITTSGLGDMVSLSLSQSDMAGFLLDGNTLRFTVGADAGASTATIVADNNAESTEAPSVFVTVQVIEALSAAVTVINRDMLIAGIDTLNEPLAINANVAGISMWGLPGVLLQFGGGLSPYSISARGVKGDPTVTVFVDDSTSVTPPVTLSVSIYQPIVASFAVATLTATADTAFVAGTVTAEGGLGMLMTTVLEAGADEGIGDDGEVTVKAPMMNGDTKAVTVVVSDDGAGSTFTPDATIVFTITATMAPATGTGG